MATKSNLIVLDPVRLVAIPVILTIIAENAHVVMSLTMEYAILVLKLVTNAQQVLQATKFKLVVSDPARLVAKPVILTILVENAQVDMCFLEEYATPALILVRLVTLSRMVHSVILLALFLMGILIMILSLLESNSNSHSQ